MFNLREFLMMGFKDSVGKIADYQVIMNASGWFEKKVLEETDLAELQELIVKKNTPEIEPTMEVPTEETTEPATENIEPPLKEAKQTEETPLENEKNIK